MHFISISISCMYLYTNCGQIEGVAICPIYSVEPRLLLNVVPYSNSVLECCGVRLIIAELFFKGKEVLYVQKPGAPFIHTVII